MSIERRLRSNPAVMLLGPRQCGKTTLARTIAADRKATFFDLEAPADRSRLGEPMTALKPLRGLVVIDESQLQPALFPVLRVLLDRKPLPARFLLLGSASPELARDVSESLAGRVTILPMAGFDLDEVGWMPCALSGGEAASRARSSPGRMQTACSGAPTSCRRSSSAILLSSASECHPWRCAGSG